MSAFMNVMLHHMEPNNAYELGQMIIKDTNLGLKIGAERYLSTGACKLYVKNAKELENAQLKMIREETAIEELKAKLDTLKQKFAELSDVSEKNNVAKEHNELAKIHDTHVEIYNHVLTETYEPIARIQRQLAKDITNRLLQGNKEAFRSLLGIPPKLPKERL